MNESNLALQEQAWLRFCLCVQFFFNSSGFSLYIILTHGIMGGELQIKSFTSYLKKDRPIPITLNSRAHIKYCSKLMGCRPKLERFFCHADISVVTVFVEMGFEPCVDIPQGGTQP